jgi:hypothetical protein
MMNVLRMSCTFKRTWCTLVNFSYWQFNFIILTVYIYTHSHALWSRIRWVLCPLKTGIIIRWRREGGDGKNRFSDLNLLKRGACCIFCIWMYNGQCFESDQWIAENSQFSLRKGYFQKKTIQKSLLNLGSAQSSTYSPSSFKLCQILHSIYHKRRLIDTISCFISVCLWISLFYWFEDFFPPN